MDCDRRGLLIFLSHAAVHDNRSLMIANMPTYKCSGCGGEFFGLRTSAAVVSLIKEYLVKRPSASRVRLDFERRGDDGEKLVLSNLRIVAEEG